MPEFLFVTKLKPSAYNFIKKETLAEVFSCKFCECLRTTFYRTPPGDCFRKRNGVTTSFIRILVSMFTFKLKLLSLILLGEAINTLHHFVGLTSGVKFLVRKFLCDLLLMML